MLDAFIIERIRQQRERQDSPRVPLRVEIPSPPHPDHPTANQPEPDAEPTRGSVVIDDTL